METGDPTSKDRLNLCEIKSLRTNLSWHGVTNGIEILEKKKKLGKAQEGIWSL